MLPAPALEGPSAPLRAQCANLHFLENFLSWKLDEPEVLHWHELEEDFSGRQPLVVATRTGVHLDGDDIGSDS